MLSATGVDLIDQVVANPDAFYPSLNLQDWQELYRVPGTAPITLERQMLLAMADCNAKLADWKAALLQAAVDAGDPVPIALPAEHTLDYEEAVYAQATALLIPLLPSLVTDERAQEALAQLRQKPGDYAARSESRLGRIMGTTLGAARLKAELV